MGQTLRGIGIAIRLLAGDKVKLRAAHTDYEDMKLSGAILSD